MSGTTGTWLLALAAVACNAAAQVLIKHAHVVDAFDWRQWLDASLLAALGLYGLSFALTAVVYARLPLSLVSPLMAGGIFVVISIVSVLFLHESLGPMRIAGIVAILAGIVLLSRSA